MGFLKLLESVRTPFGDIFFSSVTVIGSQALIILVFAVYYWCIDKKFALETGASFFISALLVHSVKISFRVPRPFIADTSLKPVEAALSGATGYSFPSGHSQTSASVMLPLAHRHRKKKWAAAVCSALTLLTVFSRMYLGVHTPADVTAGFLLGAVSAAVIIYSRRRSDNERETVIPVILMAGAVLSVIYAAVLKNLGIIGYENIADTVKNSGACIAYSAGTFLECRYLHYEPSVKTPAGKAAAVLIGLAGALALLYMPKLFLRGILVIDGIRYFLAIFWIVFIYPAVLKGYGAKRA